MPLPFSVVLVTDWALPGLLARVEDALGAGPGLAVQHRHPGATDRVFFEEGEALARVCARHGAPLFVNGRLDVALALDAHLHLPARALRPADVGTILRRGGPRWLSAAWHPADEPAPPAPVELLLVSPVFAPRSKPDDRRAPLGPSGFHAAARRAPSTPAFALGGVTAAGAHELAALAPLAGVAVVSEVLLAPSPRQAAAALLRAVGAS